MKKGTPNLRTEFGQAAVFASSVEFEDKARVVYGHLTAARSAVLRWTEAERIQNEPLVELLHQTLTKLRESLPTYE